MLQSPTAQIPVGASSFSDRLRVSRVLLAFVQVSGTFECKLLAARDVEPEAVACRTRVPLPLFKIYHENYLLF